MLLNNQFLFSFGMNTCFGFKEMWHPQNCRLSSASLTQSISNTPISCSQETASLNIFVLGTASSHWCGTQTCPLQLLDLSRHCTFEFSSLCVCHWASPLPETVVRTNDISAEFPTPLLKHVRPFRLSQAQLFTAALGHGFTSCHPEG